MERPTSDGLQPSSNSDRLCISSRAMVGPSTGHDPTSCFSGFVSTNKALVTSVALVPNSFLLLLVRHLLPLWLLASVAFAAFVVCVASVAVGLWHLVSVPFGFVGVCSKPKAGADPRDIGTLAHLQISKLLKDPLWLFGVCGFWLVWLWFLGGFCGC